MIISSFSGLSILAGTMRYLYHATFCIMILVSLHTKSSSMFHGKLFPPKWIILKMKTLSSLFVLC
jgi:hypothetical protein